MNRSNSGVTSLIVNADDFGLSHGINKGIIEAHQNGILTSTSICANGNAFDEAVELSLQNPTLDIGIHLILVGETPLAKPEEIKSLVTEEGKFHKDVIEFTKRYLLGKIDMKEVKLELSLQFKKILNSGLRLSHIDSHQHIHTLPEIFHLIEEFAETFNISNVRCPNEKIEAYMLKNPKLFPRLIQSLILKFISLRSMKNSRITKVQHFKGFYSGGNLNKEQLKNIILKLPNKGKCEIMCHPAYYRGNEKYEFWGYNHEKELKSLLDSEIADLIHRKKIILTNFSNI